MDPMIVVLGAACGGTSAVSGVLHHLGVYMASGRPAKAFREISNTWEDMELNTLMKRAFTMPGGASPYTVPKMETDRLRAELQAWGRRHRDVARSAGRIPGAKFPQLCLIVDQLTEIWRPVLTVAVDRPIEEISASIIRHGWLDNEQVAMESTKQLLEARDYALTGGPDARVDFGALQATPEVVIRRLAADLGITVDDDQVAAAVRSVAKPDDPRFSGRNAAAEHPNIERLRADAEANPGDAERIFELAEAYFGLGDYVSAKKYYLRIGKSFEDPEKAFCVAYHFAVCIDKLDAMWPLAERSYKLAFKIRPFRAEPLYAMAQHHAEEGNFAFAYQLARVAAAIPLPKEGALGVVEDIYESGARDLMTSCTRRGGVHM